MKQPNKKGVTLVELIAVLALLAVVGTMAGSFIYTMGRQYVNTMEVNSAKTGVQTVLLDITNTVRYAKNGAVNNNTTGTAIYTDGGHIYKSGTDMYDATFYGALSYSLDMTGDGNTVTVTISAINSTGKTVYTNTSAVRLLNAEEVSGTGCALHYTV